MQKSGFPKMRHYVGFLQIGSHITTAYLADDDNCACMNSMMHSEEG